MSATIDAPVFTLEAEMTGGGWVEIVKVLSFDIARGRQDELGTIEAGRLDVVADNNAGLWSPLNPSGTYYGAKWLNRPIRLKATYNAVTYPLFYGYAESWVPDNGSQVDANVAIVAMDIMKRMGKSKLRFLDTYPIPEERVGARIARLFDNWVTEQPGESLPRALDEGRDVVLAVPADTETNVLAHVQAILAGERGIFFQAADGTLTYHDRHHRFVTAAGYTSQATFGQVDAGSGAYTGGTLPYVAGTPVLDDQSVYNVITVNASGVGEVGEETDVTSAYDYDTRELSIAAPFMKAGIAQSLAEWLVYVYAIPFPRVPELVITPVSAASWAQALGREIGDRITLNIPRPGSINYQRDVWIEAIRHTYDKRGGLVTRWQLSDATSQGATPVFRLSLSALNSGHVLVH